MRTFVTGFGPFGSVTENPSARLAESSGRPFQTLEVAYAAADAFIEETNPEMFDTLLMIGVAVGRERITPELFARNWRGTTPDVRGIQVPGPIEEGEPLLIESTLWTPSLLAKLEVAVDLRTSLDAGSYLCNYLAYQALRRFTTKRVGFLHIPSFDKIPEERQRAVLAHVLEQIEA